MSPTEVPARPGRETRLLLVTIAVSAGVLLLLAQFRFPGEEHQQPADPAPAPLERLAARAAYDELASTMADLERRITPRVAVLRSETPGAAVAYAVAPRLTRDRAVTVATAEERLFGGTGPADILARDVERNLATISVPAMDDAEVPLRTGPAARTGPRYVVAVEGTPHGPALKPVYVGRMDTVQPAGAGVTSISLGGLQHVLARGSAVFTLEGMFLGLVSQTGPTATLIPAEVIRGAAESAPTAQQHAGTLRIEVQPLTPLLARATGAERGVVISRVAALTAPPPVEPGDVIVAVDGSSINTVEDFTRVERSRPVGSVALLSVIRQGTTRDVSLPVVNTADVEAAPQTNGPGVIGRIVPGVGFEVVTVVDGSAGARAGLQRGNLIVRVASRRAPDAEALNRSYRAAKPGDVILLTVQNDRRQQMIVPLEKR